MDCGDRKPLKPSLSIKFKWKFGVERVSVDFKVEEQVGKFNLRRYIFDVGESTSFSSNKVLKYPY